VNALCVWGGVATIRLLVGVDTLRLSTLKNYDPSSEVEFNGATYRLVELSPDPPVSVGIEENLPQEDYLLTLEVF